MAVFLPIEDARGIRGEFCEAEQGGVLGDFFRTLKMLPICIPYIPEKGDAVLVCLPCLPKRKEEGGVFRLEVGQAKDMIDRFPSAAKF